MRNQFRTVMFVVATLAIAHTASAQTCRGTAAIGGRSPLQIGGGLGFSKAASFLSGDAAVGTDGFFVAGSVASVELDQLEELAINAGVVAGAQVAAGPSRRLMVCPMAMFSHRFGPTAVSGHWDLSLMSFGGGAAVGGMLADYGGVQVVPTVGLFVLRRQETFAFDGEEENTESWTP